MSRNYPPSNKTPNHGDRTPAINSFEPGPVKLNPTTPSIISILNSSYSLPFATCSIKPNTLSGNVRYLNAACDYASFTIYIVQYPII